MKNSTVEFYEEQEVRMGLWASEVKIKQKDIDVTHLYISQENRYCASIPFKQYSALSTNGRFGILPTCPILREPNLLLIDTSNQTTQNIGISGWMNCIVFSPFKDEAILTSSSIQLLECTTNALTTLSLPVHADTIESVQWLSSHIILFMGMNPVLNKYKLTWYNTETNETQVSYLPTPNELFNFTIPEVKSKTLNLFLDNEFTSHSFSHLYKWEFMRFHQKENLCSFKCLIPVSEIYWNKSKQLNGVDAALRILEIKLTSHE